jgi:3-oxoadipate enol-lactonase
MPKIRANDITMNYEQHGTGEPIVLIPYLAADNACYAFQVAAYAKHFTCISLDLRGTGESDKPESAYTTEHLADDVAAFVDALGIPRAHFFGLSLGAAVSLWLGAKYPDKVRSLCLHGAWPKTDPFIKAVVESWQMLARSAGSVAEMTVRGIFPWCFSPELYAARPEYIDSLAAFVRGRPAQPLPSFLVQSNAVINHDVEEPMSSITAPVQMTFGRLDLVTSTRFADRMKSRLPRSEVVIFEGCAHAALYENVDEFNARTLDFLRRH